MDGIWLTLPALVGGAVLGWIAHTLLHKHGLARLERFWQTRFGTQRERLMSARQRLAADQLRLEKTRHELAATRQQLREFGEKLVGTERELDTLRREVATRAGEIAALKRFATDVEPTLARFDEHEARQRTLQLHLEENLRSKQAEIQRLREKVGGDGSGSDASDLRDDLTRIRGIGPSLQRWLNERGVFTYRQIAQWDSAEVARLAEQLQAFRSRIRRDRWVAGAKRAHRNKYGETL